MLKYQTFENWTSYGECKYDEKLVLSNLVLSWSLSIRQSPTLCWNCIDRQWRNNNLLPDWIPVGTVRGCLERCYYVYRRRFVWSLLTFPKIPISQETKVEEPTCQNRNLFSSSSLQRREQWHLCHIRWITSEPKKTWWVDRSCVLIISLWHCFERDPLLGWEVRNIADDPLDLGVDVVSDSVDKENKNKGHDNKYEPTIRRASGSLFGAWCCYWCCYRSILVFTIDLLFRG